MDENKTEVKTEKRGIRALLNKGKARFALMVCALCSFMSIGAFAADGDTTGGGFDSVLSSFDTLGTLMSRVWGLMTANPLLTLFLAVSLLGVGVSVFRMVKHAAHM